MRNLTDKQEKFVELVVGGMKQGEAYRQVYNTKAAARIVNRKASEELKKLSEIARGETEYADYQYDGDMGRDVTLMRRPGTRDRLKALELLGKHEGLFTEKLEVQDNELVVNLKVTEDVPKGEDGQ